MLRSGFSQHPQALQKGQYRLDPAHSSVLFKVSHFGLSQYVGRFNNIQAQLNYDPDNRQTTELQAQVATASIDVNNADFARELAGPAWLHSDAFPQAVLSVSGVERVDGNTSWHGGTLSLRGKQVPVTLRVQFNGGANNRLTGYYTIGFAATMTLQRNDFGITKFAGLVGNAVELEIHAEFQQID